MTTAHTWTSNATVEEIATRLAAARRVVLLTHSKPDGDAVGSTLALARALQLTGVDASPAYAGPWSHRFDAFVRDTGVIHLGVEERDSPKLGEPDTVCVLDTGSWSQLSEVKAWLAPRADRAVLIDHHLHGDEDVAAMRCIEVGAAAACETVARLCVLLLGVDSAARLPEAVAEPLYLGIATDTGWFRHSNVKAGTLRLASELLEAGVRHTNVHQGAEQGDRVERLMLMARAVGSMELHADGRVAVLTVTRHDFEETGAGMEDTGGFAEAPLSVEGVVVSAVITEVDDARVKISFRSKTAAQGGAAVDVNKVAMALGGGGHAQAAGARLDLPLGEAQERVLRTLLEHAR